MKKIVHIIPDQKFTAGYICYMNKEVEGELNHFFVVLTDKDKNIFELPSAYKAEYKCINRTRWFSDATVLELLETADKIIVSGLFNGVDLGLEKLEKKILSKTYLHFWGGDFYEYRNTKFFSKKHIHKIILHRCIKRCAGIITLIPGDYEELSKIFYNRKPHYVASMPGGAIEDWTKFSTKKNSKKIKVLLGNSATPENQHAEAIELLSKYINQDIEVICPLSYGNKEYAKKIANIGKEKLGDSFHPIFDYMERNKYFSMLAECEVGIFNNNRQQAMGNINSMIELGKKVYLNAKTSMWEDYTSFEIKVYDVKDIKKMGWKEFWTIPESVKKKNRSQLRTRNEQYDNNWSIILNIW